MKKNIDLLKKMTYESFKEMASNEALSKYEKIGFPDDYRGGFEEAIFASINKILLLDRKSISFLDIGCGCSDLPFMFIEQARKLDHELYMLDSAEMLYNLPDSNYTKIAAKFPNEFDVVNYKQQFDAILVYSVLQHVILDANPFHFIDAAVSMLKPKGRLLLGDIPNISKRNRFFASDSGKAFHKAFTNSDSEPVVAFNTIIEDKVDDALMLGVLMRYRNAGFETYVLEQPESLPMANRREDILIVRN